MSLTWTPVESATPTWTPASDDDLTFTTRGTLSSDDVTVAGESLTNYLTGVALLDEANEFTDMQSIDVAAPVTPVADIGTTKPTVLLHIHAGDGAIVNHYALTIDAGGAIGKSTGVLAAVTGADGLPTDEWLMLTTAPGIEVLSVTSTDPGKLPWISDILAAVPAVVTVGTPTADTHAATKAYVDAHGGGGVALGETSTTAYRGDRGKTAYDYSQAHTGATDPHGDRSYAAALVDDLSGVTDASTARTNLGLGTAATTAATAYDAAGAAATAQAAAIQRTNHTGTQAASTVTGLPWHDDVSIVHMVRDPLTSSGTAVGYIGGNMRGGGYVQSQLGSGWSWTFPRLPLRAGTYTLRSIRRTASDCGIVTFTVGGTAAGTADGYSAGNVNDVSTDATTSLVIAADGFYDLVMTSTTKHASSTNYRTNAQITRLFRTGA